MPRLQTTEDFPPIKTHRASEWCGLTKAQLAAATGFTLNEIDKMVRDGLPGEGGKSKRDGWRFDLPDVVQWLAGRNTSDDDARQASLRAVARKRTVEADKLEGKLIDIDRVERILADAAENCRAELLECGCPKCRPKIEAAINRLASVQL